MAVEKQGTGADPEKPGLLPRAPQRVLSDEPYMGLMEAVAWIATRDPEISAATRFHSLDGPAPNAAAAVFWLLDQLVRFEIGTAGAERELVRKCAGGGLTAKGRRSHGAFETIPADDWIDARMIYESAPDTLLPAGQLTTPRWIAVRLPRQEVLALWPPPAPTAVALPEETPAKVPRAEVQRWMAERIEAGDIQSKIVAAARRAFPGRIMPLTREQLRDLHRDVHGKLKRTAARPGPRPRNSR